MEGPAVYGPGGRWPSSRCTTGARAWPWPDLDVQVESHWYHDLVGALGTARCPTDLREPSRSSFEAGNFMPRWVCTDL